MIVEFHGGPRDGIWRSVAGEAPKEFRFPKSGYLVSDPQRYVALVDIYKIRVPMGQGEVQKYDWQGQRIGY